MIESHLEDGKFLQKHDVCLRSGSWDVAKTWTWQEQKLEKLADAWSQTVLYTRWRAWKSFQQENNCSHISAASYLRHRLVGTRSEVAKHTLVVPNQHLFLSPSYQNLSFIENLPSSMCGYPSSARGRVSDWSRAIIGVPFLWPVMGVWYNVVNETWGEVCWWATGKDFLPSNKDTQRRRLLFPGHD